MRSNGEPPGLARLPAARVRPDTLDVAAVGDVFVFVKIECGQAQS